MRHWALDHLICPNSGTRLSLQDAREEDGEVIEGSLVSLDGGHRYPIVDGVPRFAQSTGYCDTFGLQWNKYSRLRSDRYNGTSLIRDTITRRTGWGSSHLTGKTLLECGCGCGNDTEVLLDLGAERIIAFDLSNSVNSAQRNQRDPRVTFVQADIFELPVRRHAFDIVFCHRMIQHTPHPEQAFYSIAERVRPGGEVLLHSYDNHWASMLHWKYLMRPVTKRISGPTLLRCLQSIGPALYSIQTPALKWARSNKYLQYLISRMVPFYNYSQIYIDAGTSLTERELFEVSLLDTFDALAPYYDKPNSSATIGRWFKNVGLTSVETTGRNPVFVKGRAAKDRRPDSARRDSTTLQKTA